MKKISEIMIIAKNKDGIIARIMTLFNKRGYLVNKMTAGFTNIEGYTRMTLSVEGDEDDLNQIQKQVHKIIDVVKVKVFPKEDVIRREMMLVKISVNDVTRPQILQISNVYRGNVLDVSESSIVVELTGDVRKLDGFIEFMKKYGILEIARTGISAMSRGDKI